jgi:hypothetical protein
MGMALHQMAWMTLGQFAWPALHVRTVLVLEQG